jgi:outer membrane lipoprotein LolB
MTVARAFFRPALLAGLIGLAVVLGGCASVQTAPANTARAAPFDLLGRVLVRYQDKAFSANVRWMHAADADEISLMTPTGQALAQMREDATGATLTGADQKQYRAGRVESLTRQALGWELPMARMQYWVRGAAVPNSPVEITERNADGKIVQLAQDGWRISYEYYPAAENEGLPRRIDVVGAAQTLRLVIDTWRREAP